jgi:hypothetical protein
MGEYENLGIEAWYKKMPGLQPGTFLYSFILPFLHSQITNPSGNIDPFFTTTTPSLMV